MGDRRRGWRTTPLLTTILVATAGCGTSSSGSTPSPSGSSSALERGDATTANPAVTSTTRASTVALERSLLTAAEIAAGTGISVREVSGLRPTGALTVPGLQAALGDQLVPALRDAQASEGARHYFETVATTPQGSPVISILAIRFPTLDAAGGFAEALATLRPGTATATHREVTLGSLPVTVLRVAVRTKPAAEAVEGLVAYPNGVLYLVESGAPPASFTDASMLAVLRAQDNKYRASAATLGISTTPAPSPSRVAPRSPG